MDNWRHPNWYDQTLDMFIHSKANLFTIQHSQCKVILRNHIAKWKTWQRKIWHNFGPIDIPVKTCNYKNWVMSGKKDIYGEWRQGMIFLTLIKSQCKVTSKLLQQLFLCRFRNYFDVFKRKMIRVTKNQIFLNRMEHDDPYCCVIIICNLKVSTYLKKA